MKQTIKKTGLLLVSTLLLAGMALLPACGSPDEPASSSGVPGTESTAAGTTDGSAPATQPGSLPSQTAESGAAGTGTSSQAGPTATAGGEEPGRTTGANTSQTTRTDASSSGSTSWQQVLAGMPKDLRGTQIELFHWNPVSELPGGSKMLSDFEKQTGMRVKWTVASYDNYDVELQARVAADNSPDIVLFQWMNVNRVSLCQPVSDTGYNFNTADWDAAAMKYYTIKGKTYAVNMKNTLLNRPDVIFYNRSLIEKYDYEDPYTLWKNGEWTEKTFMEMCEDFQRQEDGPAWVISKFDLWPLLVGLQCELSYQDGKYGNNLRDPRAVSAWQVCADLYQSGLVDRSWDSAGFESGKYLFMDTSTMYTRTTQPYFANMKSNGTLGMVPYFTVDGQDTYYQPMGEYEAYGIAKGAKNAKGAPYFLRYYLDAETYDEKTFFCSDQALEVYQWCMEQPNRIMHNRYPLGSGNSASPASEVRLALEGATAAQVPTVLNTYMSVVDSVVADLNNRLNRLP